MPYEPRNLVLIDPRTFDGDPFDVAKRACQQAAGLAELLSTALEGTALMVRNAELERQLQRGDDADPTAWEESAQGRRLRTLQDDTQQAQKSLEMLAAAAGYNPRNPPKE